MSAVSTVQYSTVLYVRMKVKVKVKAMRDGGPGRSRSLEVSWKGQTFASYPRRDQDFRSSPDWI